MLMRLSVYHKACIVITGFLLLLVACVQQQPTNKSPVMSDKQKEEMLLRVNKYLVEKDVELMRSFAERKGWNMEISETGLFYEIYHRTDGSRVEEGDLVSIHYDIDLLDGYRCYSSEKEGPREFILGRSQEISGLEQGVAMMREGEKARFIIPPHLAYGLIGDEERIPARSIIVYFVELAEIK